MRTCLEFIKKYWPDTLFGRLVLVWLVTLLLGHVLEVAASYTTVQNYQVTKSEYYLSKDIAILLPLLEKANPVEREVLLKRMERQDYFYSLGEVGNPIPTSNQFTVSNADGAKIPKRALDIIKTLDHELNSRYQIGATVSNDPKELMRLQLHLDDGTPLVIHLNKINLKMPWWSGVVFGLQFLFLIGLTWFAVRQAMRPLIRLAQASEQLGASLKCEPIAENGPSEVARAAAAFNAMQKRIIDHLAERVQILASISHDLQTPITRMRLRTDLMDNSQHKDKLHDDLNAMQVLVEEGIAYARSAHSVNEAPCRVDVDALLDSLTCDYIDSGQNIQLHGKVNSVISTRPHALRRVLCNLVENALKFGEQVEIVASVSPSNQLTITVLDRGPGIPESELEAVLKPFYRLEVSRNRHSGGTGLGLAIAQQLTLALGGTLILSNRREGGLQASISLPG